MKAMTCFLMIVTGFVVSASSELFEKTTADMYSKSSMEMGRPAGLSAAEVRAENYRQLYEKCDEHHNCVNENAGKGIRPDQGRKMVSQPDTAKPFIHMPLWQ